jgi:hypothetical protein
VVRIATGITVVAAFLIAVRPVDSQEIGVEAVGQGVVSTERKGTFPAEDPQTGALWDGRLQHPEGPINSELSQPDLWLSRDGAWSTPRTLGPDVNSSDYESGHSAVLHGPG